MSEIDGNVSEPALIPGFEPLSGDDLERIDATGSCDEREFGALVRTALHHRQQAMDARDETERLRTAVRDAALALDRARFTTSADRAWAAASHVGRLPGV